MEINIRKDMHTDLKIESKSKFFPTNLICTNILEMNEKSKNIDSKTSQIWQNQRKIAFSENSRNS